MQDKIESDKFFDEIISNQSKILKEKIDLLKSFIDKYIFLPVLSMAFINDNLIFYKSNGTVNDDFLLSNYIADLYLSFQRNKKLELPDFKTTNEIFDCCREIYQTCFVLDMVGSEINEEIKDSVVMFKYTERSFYLPIFSKIFFDIVDNEYLDIFYEKTGFRIEYIVPFRNMLTCLIQDRVKEQICINNCMLEFSAKEILHYVNKFYKNDNKIDLIQIENLINYFHLDTSNNNNYLPRINIPIEKKPIFTSNDKFICFNPLILVKNLFGILEYEIKKDSVLFDKYSTSKGANLERSAISILQNLFPEADIYQGLEYFASDGKWHETDIIVDLGNYLLIVEAKARKFRSQAKEGNYKIYKSSINKIITEAQEQCKSTYEYILENEISSFFRGKGKEFVLSLNRNNYIDIFLFTVELEILDSITSDLYDTIPIFEKNPIPTFSIYDLYIIADVLKTGSLFLIYLEQRRTALKDKIISSSNELDYLSLFLDRDLKFNKKDEKGNSISVISIGNYSDVLDKYYIENKKINSYPIAKGSNILFQQLRMYDRKLAFVIEKEFISANIEIQKDILRNIEKLKKKTLDGSRHDCSFFLEDCKIGISFFCYKKRKDFTNFEEIEKYVKYKLKENRVCFWFYVVFSLKPNKVQLIGYIKNNCV